MDILEKTRVLSYAGRHDSCGPKASAVEIKQLKMDGLFLSSAVYGDPDKVTERMIELVSLLRSKYLFNGYVHFKVLPGTSYEELYYTKYFFSI